MQDPRMPLPREFLNHTVPQTKKGSTQKAPSSKLRKSVKAVPDGSLRPKPTPLKVSKRVSRNKASPFVQFPERSTSDSLPDSGYEYRALRRKYLLLEEESFTLGSSLKGLENDVRNLEDQKHALLDELVVLEGLIDPSELRSLSQGML